MTKVAKRLKKELSAKIKPGMNREIHFTQTNNRLPNGNIKVIADVGYMKDDSYVQADYFGKKFIKEQSYEVETTPQGKLINYKEVEL